MTEESTSSNDVKVASSAHQIVGVSYVMRSMLYDWGKTLSILPAKYIMTVISTAAKRHEDVLGENIVGYTSSIFKTSLDPFDLFVGVVGRYMSVIGTKTYGDPLKLLEKATGSKLFSKTPEQNLYQGNIPEYMAQRLLFTASTNFMSAACGIVAKVMLAGMVLPNTVPALAAAYVASYSATYVGRVIADIIQDVTNFSKFDPDRPKLISELEKMRERAAQQGTKQNTTKAAYA